MQWGKVKNAAELTATLFLGVAQALLLVGTALVEALKFVAVVVYVLLLDNAPDLVARLPFKISTETLQQYYNGSKVEPPLNCERCRSCLPFSGLFANIYRHFCLPSGFDRLHRLSSW